MLDTIINWSEVWSLVIPLLVVLVYRPKGPGVNWLISYLLIAFTLNTIATIMVEYYFSMPAWLKNNNILYNLHSLSRVLLLGFYIMAARPSPFAPMLKTILIAYGVFVVFNFSFTESPFFISSRLFTAESIILLIFCFSFFFRSMQDESETNWLKHPAFLVCTGICLYEVTSFFIFLFFYPLVLKNWEFADLTMSIHNVMYVIFCVLLAIALYRYKKKNIATG